MDDTYMYDDAARGSIRPHQMGHWYDEPPYESDPDDFLMGINSGPAAIIQVYAWVRFLYSIVCIRFQNALEMSILSEEFQTNSATNRGSSIISNHCKWFDRHIMIFNSIGSVSQRDSVFISFNSSTKWFLLKRHSMTLMLGSNVVLKSSLWITLPAAIAPHKFSSHFLDFKHAPLETI